MEKRKKPKPKKRKYEINDEAIFALDYVLVDSEREKPKREVYDEDDNGTF